MSDLPRRYVGGPVRPPLSHRLDGRDRLVTPDWHLDGEGDVILVLEGPGEPLSAPGVLEVDDVGDCAPSQAALIRRSGRSRRTVKRALSWLAGNDVVKVVSQPEGNRYLLNWDRLVGHLASPQYDRRQLLHVMFFRLPPKEAAVVWLRAKEGKSFSQVGECLGFSKQHACKVYQSAVERMRGEFDEGGEGREA